MGVEYWVYEASKGRNIAECWQNIKKEQKHLLEKKILMGASKWKNHGQKFGYWKYFKKEEKGRIVKKILKRRPRVVSGPGDYKRGFNDCNEAWKTYLYTLKGTTK